MRGAGVPAPLSFGSCIPLEGELYPQANVARQLIVLWVSVLAIESGRTAGSVLEVVDLILNVVWSLCSSVELLPVDDAALCAERTRRVRVGPVQGDILIVHSKRGDVLIYCCHRTLIQQVGKVHTEGQLFRLCDFVVLLNGEVTLCEPRQTLRVRGTDRHKAGGRILRHIHPLSAIPRLHGPTSVSGTHIE